MCACMATTVYMYEMFMQASIYMLYSRQYTSSIIVGVLLAVYKGRSY